MNKERVKYVGECIYILCQYYVDPYGDLGIVDLCVRRIQEPIYLRCRGGTLHSEVYALSSWGKKKNLLVNEN